MSTTVSNSITTLDDVRDRLIVFRADHEVDVNGYEHNGDRFASGVQALKGDLMPWLEATFPFTPEGHAFLQTLITILTAHITDGRWTKPSYERSVAAWADRANQPVLALNTAVELLKRGRVIVDGEVRKAESEYELATFGRAAATLKAELEGISVDEAEGEIATDVLMNLLAGMTR